MRACDYCGEHPPAAWVEQRDGADLYACLACFAAASAPREAADDDDEPTGHEEWEPGL